MAEKVKCEVCDRIFKDINGLAQHKADKHKDEKDIRKSKVGKKIKKAVISIVIILAILAFGYWTISSALGSSSLCKNTPAEEMNIGGHQNLALHIHQELRIIIDGENQIIPTNIGIGPGIMRPVHTHDSTGEIHVEGPCRRDFVLGDFFRVWGMQFNSRCIFDNCEDEGELTMTVNGEENEKFENLVLREGDNIIIDYKSYSFS